MATREQIDAALSACNNWRIRSTLWTEESEAFVILMAPRDYNADELRLAWRWFEEGYQCGLAMQCIRQLKRAAADEQQG